MKHFYINSAQWCDAMVVFLIDGFLKPKTTHVKDGIRRNSAETSKQEV